MKLKWQTIFPPTYRTLRIANYTVAAMGAAVAVTADGRWPAMLAAFVCGFNVAAAISCTMQEQMKIAFDRMCKAFGELSVLNHQLIAGKVQIMMEGGDPNEDRRPSLH